MKQRHALHWLLAAAVGAATLLATTGSAEASQRVMVILQESLDGAAATTKVGEVRLAELLGQAGAQVTEAVETEQARQRISVDKLLGGAFRGEVTALNVDLLVVGKIETTAEEIPYGVQDIKAVTAEWTLRAIAVDTGRVVLSKTGQGNGSGKNPRAASAAARRKVAETMAAALKDVVAGGGAAGGTVGLSVEGLTDLEAAQRLQKVLAKAPGVRKVQLRFASGSVSRLDLEVDPTSDAMAIASALKRVSKGSLQVTRVSANVVHARYVPHGQGRSIVIARFRNETGLARHDWLGSTLPEVFETELSNSRYLRVLVPAERPEVPSARPDAKTVKQVLSGADAQLLCAGKIDKAGANYRLSLSVFQGSDGASVTAANVFGTEAELLEATRKLVWEVDKRLYDKLFAKQGLGRYEPVILSRAPQAARGATGGGGDRLSIAAVELDNLYPALLPVYASRPFGELTLTNPTRATMRGVRVQVQIPQVASAPAIARVPDIGPGATQKVPLTMVLDRDKVLAIKENTPARADIVVSYANGQGDVTDAFTQSLVVFDKNAIDWRHSERVAAFVTHKDPAMEAFAASAVRAGVAPPKGFPKALATPMLLFEALASLPTQYQKDADNPFGSSQLDSVAYPAETLRRRAGDCDDLSVLYAALLQSQGVGAAFVLTPGHILVAVDSGVRPDKARARLGLDPAHLLSRHGTAWVPVEVTRLQGSFSAAVTAGVAETRRHREAPSFEVVGVAEAWRTYPPFPGPFEAGAKVTADAARLTKRAGSSDQSLSASQAGLGGDTPTAASVDDPRELNRLGVELASAGRVEQAADFFKRGAEKAPDDPDLRYNLANVQVVRKELDQAELGFRRLLTDKRYKKKSLHGLGVVSYLRGDTKGAASLFGKARLKESRETAARLGLVLKKRPKRHKPEAQADSSRNERVTGIRAAGEVDVTDLLVWAK